MELVRELARMALRAVMRRAERMARFEATAGSDRRYAQATQLTRDQLRDMMPQLSTELRNVLNNGDALHTWDDPYVRAMVYQMLLAMPFSSYMVARKQQADPEAPAVVRRAALLFDLTVLPNNELRPLATRWVNWSYKRLSSLAATVAMLRATTVGDVVTE
jgi:hypothetical protein